MLVVCGGAELLAQEQTHKQKINNIEPSLFQDLGAGGKGLN